MQLRSKFVVSVVSIWGALACGDDDGGSTGGVSDGKKVGDLSESEARSLCRGLDSKFKKIGSAQTDLICVTQSKNGEDVASCESALAECQDELGEVLDLDCDGTEGETGGVSSECEEVTVGELNSCLDALSKELEAIAAMADCRSDLDDLSTAYEVPAACTAIESKCPDIAEMGSR